MITCNVKCCHFDSTGLSTYLSLTQSINAGYGYINYVNSCCTAATQFGVATEVGPHEIEILTYVEKLKNNFRTGENNDTKGYYFFRWI